MKHTSNKCNRQNLYVSQNTHLSKSEKYSWILVNKISTPIKIATSGGGED